MCLPVPVPPPAPRLAPPSRPCSKAEEARKRSSGRTKNLALLSFGEEAEEEEAQLLEVAKQQAAAAGGRMRSAHDMLADEK